ncbi:MAG: acetate/propionate family kinase [Burkholderiaceae bacterium]
MSTLQNPIKNAVLAVNAGSSSLKFALYPKQNYQVDKACLTGIIEGLEPGGIPTISVSDDQGESRRVLSPTTGSSFDHALDALHEVLTNHADSLRIVAIAHRIVHGGERYSASILLDDAAQDYLKSLSNLAPLHQPHNLRGVDAFRRAYPDLLQIGCFDTGFHATIPVTEQMFALPQALRAAGIRRYGFHGLSYRYVAGRLAERSKQADKKVLIAHLGNGASVCALLNGKSIATSMGFSALDGLMMGTRSGAVDPGVLLHLMRQGWDLKKMEHMLYRESGLLGVSGISADMRILHASDNPDAALAINLFTYRLIKESGALTACLGGLDLLAFTGGIGEHDAALRLAASEQLQYLGIKIDAERNLAATGTHMLPIHAPDSKVEVWVVPTDEGRVAAGDAAELYRH